jgi:hypothetical protein
MGTIYRNGVPFAGSFDAGGVNYDNSSSGLSATNVQAAVDEVNGKVDDNAEDITALNNGLTYVDSDQLTITANASSNSIEAVNFGNRLNGYTVLGYSVFTNSISGSWNVQVSYINGLNRVSFYNLGTAQNTWKGFVRAAVKKN